MARNLPRSHQRHCLTLQTENNTFCNPEGCKCHRIGTFFIIKYLFEQISTNLFYSISVTHVKTDARFSSKETDCYMFVLLHFIH